MIILAILLTLIVFPYLFSLVLVGGFFALLGFVFGSFSLYNYGYRIALSVDQTFNVFLLGFPDESISGRVGRAIQTGKPKSGVVTLGKVIDWIFLVFFNDENHVRNSVEPEDDFGSRYEEFKLYRE
jgi:hypothetical protein